MRGNRENEHKRPFQARCIPACAAEPNGKVHDGYVSKHRGSTPDQWERLARKRDNETIFKDPITLLDNLEAIVVRGKEERRQLLEVFRMDQISEQPDRRKVEEAIMVQ